MAAKYLLLDGMHYVGEQGFPKGSEIISDDDLVKIHGSQKFKFIEEVAKAEAKVDAPSENKKGK